MTIPIMNNPSWMQEVLRAGNTGLWSIVIDTVHRKNNMYADDTMLKLLGMEKHPIPDECYAHWFSRIDPKYVDYVTKSVDQMVQTEKLIEVQYPWNHPQWGIIYVRCGGKVEESKDGVIQILGYHQNISELELLKRENKLHNEELDEILHQRKSYNALFHSVLCGILNYTYEENGLIFKKVNKEALRIFQYTEKEFKEHGAWRIEELVATEDIPDFCNSMKYLKTVGDKADREIRFKTKSGDKVWVIEKTELVKDADGEEVYQSVFIDNNENKRKTVMLEEITENIPGGVCLVDLDTKKIVYGNDGFYHLYGCTEQEMQEKFCNSAMKFFYEDDLKKLDLLVSEAVKSGKKSITYERQIHRKDEKNLWVLVKATIIHNLGSLQLSCVLIDITDRKKMEHELFLNEKRLSIALEQVVNVVFDYDIKTNCMVLKSGHLGNCILGEPIDNPVETLVAKGILHKDYKDVFETMCQQIADGEECVTAELLIRYELDSAYIWTKVVLQNIYKENGASRWAVGGFEDISLQKSAEMALKREKKYRQAMLADTLASAEINLTKNVVERTSGIWKRRQESTFWIYDELVEITVNEAVYEEDRHHYLSLASRQALMQMYEQGETEINCEHRRVGRDGSVRWMLLTAHIVKDSSSSDLKALIYLKDIDTKKKEELEILYQSQRDSLTGLYNKGTSEQLMKEAIKKEKPAQFFHAFIIIDLDKFKMINDNYGHQYGDEVLKKSAEILTEIFRFDDIVGRLGGDELVVLMRNISNKGVVTEKLKQLRDKFSRISQTKEPVTASIGVAFYDEHGNSYDQLYQNADIALYRAKEKGRDCFEFFEYE